jgi:hypothetical protein
MAPRHPHDSGHMFQELTPSHPHYQQQLQQPPPQWQRRHHPFPPPNFAQPKEPEPQNPAALAIVGILAVIIICAWAAGCLFIRSH